MTRKRPLTLSLLAGVIVTSIIWIHSSHSATPPTTPFATFDSDEFKIKPSVGQTVLKSYLSASEIGFAFVSGVVTFPPDASSPAPITLPLVDTVIPGAPASSAKAAVRFNGTALTFITKTNIQSIDLHVVTVYKR
jgi:hypothetical protein